MLRSTACALPDSRSRSGELRGRVWLMVSFVFCPCHLPVTLGVIALIGGGSALGTFARGNGVLIGVVVTALWLAGTARGFWLIRQANRAAMWSERREAIASAA